MYNIWCNSYFKKNYDINYINNTLNVDFFNKYNLFEFFYIKNYNKLLFNNNFELNSNNNYVIINKTFNSLKTYLNKYTTIYGPNLLNQIFFYKNNEAILKAFLIPMSNIKFKNIDIMPLNINIFKNITPSVEFLNIAHDIIKLSNNIIKFKLHNNFINFNHINILNFKLYNFIIIDKNFFNFYKFFLLKKELFQGKLYFKFYNMPVFFKTINLYKIKNMSQLFANSWIKHFNFYYVVIISFSLLLSLYIYNGYRLNIWWCSNIVWFVKLLYTNFFINNILRVSKKLWILICMFIFNYILNIFLYSEYNIECINIFSNSVIIIFLCIIFYFAYKYNLFFLIFLELSIFSGKHLLYVIKQYSRDMLNILAYFLRLSLLFIRLNIYDGLDDFFDSYYIFIGDFDIYDYLEIIYIYSFIAIPNMIDNLYDKSILSYEDVEFYLNLIYLYIVLFIKFVIFLVLLLEGAFRLLLASYIFILVILEINNFNVLFLENKNKN